MSADYTEGYNDGYAAAEAAGKRDLAALGRKCTSMENDREYNAELVDERDKRIAELEALLKAAVKVIEAYGEDEGYTPSRVAEEYEALEKAGFV
jgi:hypothetical protein